MKAKLAAVLVAVALTAGCTAAGDISGPGLAPIPGSITYNGQPRTKLTKSPIGSAFPHTFYEQRPRGRGDVHHPARPQPDDLKSRLPSDRSLE